MERSHLPLFVGGFREWFLEMGFSIILEEPVTTLERIEFCQAQPVFDGHGYTMVRSLKSFSKDAISLVPLASERTFKMWLAAVGDGGMSLTGGIPMWQEFYSVMQRSAEGLSSKRRRRGATRFLDCTAMETGMMMAAKGMLREYGHVCPETRFSFWLAFGVIPDYQRAVEDLFRTRAPIAFRVMVDEPLLPLGGFAL